jgi:serine/threonine-protein kinase
MFYDEARITSVLHHPNIAQVLDLGGEGEAAYIAMEFIAGQNLNQISTICQKRKRLIPLGLSVSVCRDVCHALHYAHTIKDSAGRESPIIHRDVAQKNVMVTYEGAVKLLDFGIAKARGSLGRTTAGMVKGTTGYMSPEQVRGEQLDGRSDVFCMGVVLFELLTGKRLFAAETETEEMERILAAPIPRPDALQRKIPSGLVEVVLKALARDRTQRFASARAMARALDDVGGKWMYDSDKRAAFMRFLFAERIDATKRLLESAGRSEVTEEYRKDTHTLTEDPGAVFPELNVAETDPEYLPDEAAAAAPAPVEPAPPPAPAAPPPKQEPTPSKDVAQAMNGGLTPEQVVAAIEAEASAAASGARAARVRARTTSTKVALRIAAVVALAGVALFLALTRKGAEPPPPPPPAPVAPTPAPTTIVTEPVVVKPPEVESGALTLTTTPRARVMKGTEFLGQSPLSEISLPAGTHQLTLVPADGPARRLDVKIEVGEVTRVTTRLASLPKARR